MKHIARNCLNMTEQTSLPPQPITIDDGNTESVSGGWSPVDPSPIPHEEFCLLQHDVRVIKANVQLLLDRILALEQHVEKVVEAHVKDKK